MEKSYVKTIFITGGATGIGAASVEKFHFQGWNVGFMDFDAEAAARLVEKLGGGDRLMAVTGDVRCKDDIFAAVEAVKNRFGRIDSVFANAGIHQRNTVLNITDDELDNIIHTNIYGTVNTLRAAVPALIEAGGGTVVINCSDQWFVGKRQSFAYGLTKGALGQITRSLALDLGPENIRVNAVCAGTIHTPLVDKLFRRIEEAGGATVAENMAAEDALYPRGSMGEPAEVAELVYFLASDASSFCTGGHYLVDGGLVAGR